MKTFFALLMTLSLVTNNSFAEEICDKDVDGKFGTKGIEELNSSISDATIPKAVKEIGDRLANLSGPNCEKKIWPDHKLLSTPIKIVDQDSGGIFKYNHQEKKFEFSKAIETDAEKSHGEHSFDKLNDKNSEGGINLGLRTPPEPPKNADKTKIKKAPLGAICVQEKSNYDKTIAAHPGPEKQSTSTDVKMKLLAHENFHNVDQDPGNPVHKHTGGCHWSTEEFNRTFEGDKGEITKIRQHIMLNLKKAVDANPNSKAKTEALQQVKSWTNVLNSKYPDAAKKLNSVDRTEGTADYVGLMSNAYGKLGCDAAIADVQKEAQKYFSDRYFNVPQNVDQQAYLLGSASGFLLDQTGQAGSWKEKSTKNKKTPLELLLEDPSIKSLPSVTPKEDPTLKATSPVSAAINSCMQNEVDKSINPVIENPDDYVLVETQPGPFGNTGTYGVDTAEGYYEVYTEGRSQKADFMFDRAQVIATSKLCGRSKESKFVAVPRSLLQKDGTINETAQGEHIKYKGKIPPTTKEKWNGVSVACQKI